MVSCRKKTSLFLVTTHHGAGDFLVEPPCSAGWQPRSQPAGDRIQPDSLLLHGVALTNGDGLIFQSVEVDGDTKWRADFVLAPVASTDRASIVKVNVPAFAKIRC